MERGQQGKRKRLETSVAPLRDAGVEGFQMLDQRLLPGEERWLTLSTSEEVAEAIRKMVVRGAPAIGIAAAWGFVYGLRQWQQESSGEEPVEEVMTGVVAALEATRPTAVNLFWALRRMRRRLSRGLAGNLEGRALLEAVAEEAAAIAHEDREGNLRMAQHGAALLPESAQVLTHCNTGGLATGGYGTALGVIRAAWASGRLSRVWVDETRPYLQGARLTAWECLADGIPATLITDSMAGHFMQRGQVDAVIVGADRIAANGDVANKIGTYSLAVLCRHHQIPFYVAAPLSTLDPEVPDGSHIPIEERSAEEVTHVQQRAIAPTGVEVAHPAFDVTPAELIAAIVTEAGVLRPPLDASIRRALQGGGEGP